MKRFFKQKKPTVIKTLITSILISHTLSAAAQDLQKVEEPQPKQIFTLDSVVVIGNTETEIEKSLAGSVDVVTRDELQYESVNDTAELFTKLPGVALNRYNQGIINNDLSIRGFAGDGETPHAKLLIDGIPSNLHNGFSEMDQLFPLLIDNIQVFKGTSDPSVGLFNIAGNYRIDTRRDLGKQIQVTYGSYDTKEIQGYGGFKVGDFTQNYALDYRTAEGYRRQLDLEKVVFAGRWQYDFEKSSLSLITRYATYDADSPGYLSKAQARSNPRSSASFASEDGGDKTTKHISLHYDHFFSDDLSLSLKAYAQNFERERWVRFTQAGALQNRYDDQDQIGFIANGEWKLNDQWKLNAGFDMENQDVIEQRFGTIGQRRVRNTANVLRNRDFEFDTHGGFLQITNQPTDYLTWNAAVRADKIDGDYVQFNAAGVAQPRNIYDFGTIVQPKVNVFLKVAEPVTLFANAGRTFAHPFADAAFTTGNTNLRDVSYNDGWEIGAKSTLFSKINTRISYWEQKASDEFVVVDGNGQNVGETKRKGLDVNFNYPITDQLELWGNYSTISAKIDKTSTANAVNSGNYLRSIPNHVASLGVTYDYNDKLTLRTHVDRQGSYYVNEANLGGKFGEFTLFNASADYKTSWGSVGFIANNIFDQFYEYVFDFSANGTDTIHSPGAGRNFTVNARVDF